MACAEELLWRGLLLEQLGQRASVWFALVVSTLLFASTHRRSTRTHAATGASFGLLYAITAVFVLYADGAGWLPDLLAENVRLGS